MKEAAVNEDEIMSGHLKLRCRIGVFNSHFNTHFDYAATYFPGVEEVLLLRLK